MTTQAIVPIPEGATGPGVASAPPAQQRAGMVPIPQGATGPGIDRIQQRKASVPAKELSPEEMGSIGATGAGLGNNPFTTGALKGAAETAHTVGRIINKVTGDNVPWLPTSLEQPKELGSANTAESAGKIGENLAEFVMGDETLKGMSIFEKLEHAKVISDLAQKSPLLQKLLMLGMRSAQGATVGGLVGGAHEGAKGAKTGAELGAVGAPLEDAAGAVLGKARSLLFPSEEVQGQVVRDAIRKTLGNKVDASVADELAGRVNKTSILSPMENELKLAKAQLDTELPQMESQLDKTLAGSTAKTGNASRIVNKTFDDLISDVNKGVGTNKQGAIETINEVRKEVTDKLSNNPMSAEEVNNVKRLIGDQIKKFQPPDLLNTADAQKKEAYRQAYFSLRDIVSQLEPATKDLNTKISKGIEARDVLRHKFPNLETPEQAKASYQGAKSEAVKGLVKKGAKLVAGGSAVAGAYGLGKELLKTGP